MNAKQHCTHTTENICPIPGAHSVHEDMKNNRRIWLTGIAALGEFIFYSCPDYISSRPVRALVKTAVTAIMGASVIHSEGGNCHKPLSSFIRVREQDDPWGIDELENSDGTVSETQSCASQTQQDDTGDSVDASQCPVALPRCVKQIMSCRYGAWTLTGGVIALAIVACVGQEKYLYRRAERARARGKVAAHTRQALFLSAISAGLFYVADRFEEKRS